MLNSCFVSPVGNKSHQQVHSGNDFRAGDESRQNRQYQDGLLHASDGFLFAVSGSRRQLQPDRESRQNQFSKKKGADFASANDGHASVILQNSMMVNCTGDPEKDLHFALRSFEPYLAANKRIGKPVAHISLNPDPERPAYRRTVCPSGTGLPEKTGFRKPVLLWCTTTWILTVGGLHAVTVRVDEKAKKYPPVLKNYARRMPVASWK
jgi:hypothetical protein